MTHKPSCSCRCSCAGNTAGPNRSQRGSGQSCARHPGRHISLRNITPAARPGTCQVLVAFLSPLWRFPVRRWSHAFASRHCHSPCSVSSNRCRPRRRHHRHVRQVFTGAGRSRNTGRTHRCHSTQLVTSLSVYPLWLPLLHWQQIGCSGTGFPGGICHLRVQGHKPTPGTCSRQSQSTQVPPLSPRGFPLDRLPPNHAISCSVRVGAVDLRGTTR